MDLVQQSAAAHGDLAMQEFITEQRTHGAAQEQILFDLPELGPGDVGLVCEHIAAGEWGHIRSLAFWMSRHREMAGRVSRSTLAGTSGVQSGCAGSQASTARASFSCPASSST